MRERKGLKKKKIIKRNEKMIFKQDRGDIWLGDPHFGDTIIHAV
jgi:hypothetical protein